MTRQALKQMLPHDGHWVALWRGLTLVAVIGAAAFLWEVKGDLATVRGDIGRVAVIVERIELRQERFDERLRYQERFNVPNHPQPQGYPTMDHSSQKARLHHPSGQGGQ